MHYTIQDGEPLHRALRKFKRQVASAGILADERKHRHFVSASEKRRKKIRVAAVRRAKMARVAKQLAKAAW